MNTMKLKLFFLLTGLVLLVSCKDECYGCKRRDLRIGYFFKNSDTINYYFEDNYFRFVHYRDSLNAIGYSEYIMQNSPPSYFETCTRDEKYSATTAGYSCYLID